MTQKNALRASDPIAPTNAHINAALTDFASAYQPGDMIADFVSPVILTEKKSDDFHKRLRKDVSTAVANRVGVRGKLNESTYDITTGEYKCLGYGLSGPVPLELQATADAALSVKEWATKDVMVRNALCREIRVADQVMTSGNWAASATAAATAVWTSTSSGVPLDDIHGALESMPSKGDSLKVGACALEVFNALKRHPQIRDLHGTGQGQISRETLAEYLGLDELHVSEAWKNTANTGQAASYSRVWLATAFAILLVPKVVVTTQQTMFCATFRRNIKGSKNGILTREWHVANEGTEGTDMVACTHEDDEVIVQDDSGFLITGVRA